MLLSRPHSRRKNKNFHIDPNIEIKQRAINDIRDLLERNNLTPIYVKHPHERTGDLQLEGWVTGLSIHNAPLIRNSSACFSLGTSLSFDSWILGLTMIDHRPDAHEDSVRQNWFDFCELTTTREELNEKFQQLEGMPTNKMPKSNYPDKIISDSIT